MQAVWYERNGAARDVLVYGEIPIPALGVGKVRVRLLASSVNIIDIKRRRGQGSASGLALPFPRIIPHDDGAGVIDRIGEGVPESRLGERVWVYLAQAGKLYGPQANPAGRAFGTAAEYVVLPSWQAVRLPDRVDFVAAAVLGIPGITAHRCVFADGPVAGQTVLVEGGAGGVGQYAVQLAKWGGATVIATGHGDRQPEIIRARGADHFVDFTENAAEQILDLTHGRGADRIIETNLAANLDLIYQVLAPQGTVAFYGSDQNPTPAIAISRLNRKEAVLRTIYYYAFPPESWDAALRDLTQLMEQGALQHPVARRFPLSQVVAAHEAVEQGNTLGKNVIDIG